MQHIRELERIASLGMPEWSDEVVDRSDGVLAQLDTLCSENRQVRDEVLSYLEDPPDELVASWLELLFRPGMSPQDRNSDGCVKFANLEVAAQPALFLAEDEISVPGRRRRRLKRPWERSTGWFFGHPQESSALSSWPTGASGEPLDFLAQIDLGAAAEAAGALPVGLPVGQIVQIFVDLEADLGPIDHRVVAFETGTGHDALMKPPRKADVHDAWPVPINPVAALTVPPLADIDTDERDKDFYVRCSGYVDAAPYERNLFRDTSAAEGIPRNFAHVPMARMGGFPVAEISRWRQVAQQVLGCAPSELFLLYDGPIEPESAAVDDPDRLRIMVLIETARLAEADFSRTLAIQY